MASPLCRSGRTIQSEERNIIACVIKCCDEESRQKCLAIPLSQSTERAARYCNKSMRTILRIRNEIRRNPEGAVLPTPGITHNNQNIKKAEVNQFDRRIIRDFIYELYLVHRTVPTCRKLLPLLKARINFRWQRTTLRKIINDMGYEWRKIGQKRRVLIENEDIMNARCEYLQKIRHYKQVGKPIFYLDKTWVDTNITFRKCWVDKKQMKNSVTAKEYEKVHVVHIGGSNGFLDGCELVYTTDDRQGYMTWERIKSWICNKVLPQLETPSVIVVHNMGFIGRPVSKRSSSKKDMASYLRSRGIPCEEVMRRFTLMSLTEATSDKEKVNHFENLLAAHGHTIVQLPTNMCDLNPMELAWHQIREYIKSVNDIPTCGPLSSSRLQHFVRKTIKCVTAEHWATYCRYVTKFENSLWEKDASMEEVIEKIMSDADELIDINDCENDGFDDTDNSDYDDEDEDYPCQTDVK